MVYTYKSKSSFWFGFLLFISLGGMLFFFWFGRVWIGSGLLLVNVFWIRSFLYTEYRITPTHLRISSGYLPEIVIPLSEITLWESTRRLRMGYLTARPNRVIICSDKSYYIAPIRPDLFDKGLRRAIESVDSLKGE